MRSYDVVICGGGLAGSAVARELAMRGLSSLVCEREETPRRKPGELVGPNAAPFMDAFRLAPRLRDNRTLAITCTGIRSDWGAHGEDRRLFLLETGGRGFAVDRLRFDAEVRAEAVAAGADWLCGTSLGNVERSRDGWRVCIRTPKQQLSVSTRTLVDATGRPAALGRRLGARRLRGSKLVALHAQYTDAPLGFDETVLRVAAMPSGWRYELGVPGGYTICYVTDSVALSALSGCLRWRLLAVLTTEEGVSELGLHAARVGEIHAFDAGAAALIYEGDDPWLAVGEAAVCFDPLSSQGIAHAFASARVAADAITSRLDGNRTALTTYRESSLQICRTTIRDIASLYQRARHAKHRFYREATCFKAIHFP